MSLSLWNYKVGVFAPDVETKAGNVAIRLLRWLRHRLRVAAARDELGMMSDETLRDLALSRCQLDYIAEQSAREDE
ncbi:DUF1127 domain-containing protein [Pseudolabrys sp. FHR47]|uniref:DUF1127 domain-containing protein n=1 Tax=Pseudolabrys sp. FHR47 TaxID=2562284 RepID=UPI0010BF42D2|nr:DUF1127 domain-containing protein [Pseudolabrys sp. FHR47]